jgi:hypothetical protein
LLRTFVTQLLFRNKQLIFVERQSLLLYRTKGDARASQPDTWNYDRNDTLTDL